MPRRLGVYLGNNKITIVDVDGMRVVSQASMALEEASSQAQPDSSGIVSLEVKQVAELQELIKDNKIERKNTFVGMSGKDLFIRGFQMPYLNKGEIDSGVRFEAKKYISYRTEDLFFDYQYTANKKLSRMDVLFTAAVKNSIDKYMNLLDKAALRVQAIEPAGFSLLRLLFFTKQLEPKISCALVSIQGSDVDFSIFSDGFPCFSRDMKLSQVLGVSPVYSGSEELSIHGRLASEIRVSLDYFRRHFSGRSVGKILILTRDNVQEMIVSLGKGLSLPVELVDLSKDERLSALADLDALRAYAVALRAAVNINLSIDLFKKRTYDYAYTDKEKVIVDRAAAFDLKKILQPALISIGLVVFALVVHGNEVTRLVNKLNRLQKEAKDTISAGLSALSVEQFKKKKVEYTQKIKSFEQLVNSRIFMTPVLNAIPGAIKKGMWLKQVDVSLKDGSKNIYIKGAIYLADPMLEQSSVKEFLENLKSKNDFMRGLQKIELVSLSQAKEGDYTITVFEIKGN